MKAYTRGLLLWLLIMYILSTLGLSRILMTIAIDLITRGMHNIAWGKHDVYMSPGICCSLLFLPHTSVNTWQTFDVVWLLLSSHQA